MGSSPTVSARCSLRFCRNLLDGLRCRDKEAVASAAKSSDASLCNTLARAHHGWDGAPDSRCTVAHKSKRGLLTNSGEWAKHLRKVGRRFFWSGERNAVKKEIEKQKESVDTIR